MLTAVVGINWGDEGKGRMVDLFSAEHEIVVRYQGGNNAGHTVVNERGKFILNLLPSGILRPGTVNVLGPGMVLDLEHLTNEVAHIREQGVAITPEHLKISDRATICMPYHKRCRLSSAFFCLFSVLAFTISSFNGKHIKQVIYLCHLRAIIAEDKIKRNA